MKQWWRLLPALAALSAQVRSSGGYDHINTPYFKVILTNSYEDGITGAHLRGKQDQDRAMQGRRNTGVKVCKRSALTGTYLPTVLVYLGTVPYICTVGTVVPIDSYRTVPVSA